MTDGGWEHEYRGKQTDYDEYELGPEQRESIDRIIAHVKRGYADEQQCREHINYLEHLSKKIGDVLRSEEGFGYSNVTLKHDYKKIQRLLDKLGEELSKLDPEDF